MQRSNDRRYGQRSRNGAPAHDHSRLGSGDGLGDGRERSRPLRILGPARVRCLSWPDAETDLVWRQGGLGRVSKMGNRYLRRLLVVGAHAVLYHRKPHEDALRSWAKKLIQTKPFKLVAVALANKMARIAFAILRGKTSYSPSPA